MHPRHSPPPRHSLVHVVGILCTHLRGIVVAFLVFVSTHEATSPNWNLLWLNPFTIIPAVCIWLKKAKKLIICYQIANFGAILCVAAIAIIGIQSFNPAILPLLLLDAMLAATYIKLNQW